MNLFVTAIFVICCCIAECSQPVSVDDWPQRLVTILILTSIAPLAAVMQTRSIAAKLNQLKQSPQRQDAMIGRLSKTHSLIWAASGLLIFLLLDWPSVVAQIGNLSQLPVVYEAFLVSPLLVSLIGSWLAFFDIQQFYGRPKTRWSLNWGKRWNFASLRIRVHLIATLAPLIIVLTSIRLAPLLTQFSTVQIILGAAIAGLWVCAMLPYLFMLIWDTQVVADPKQKAQLQSVFDHSQIAVSQIRIWKTGNQIANAAVAGFLPGFRIVVLTDTLMKHFTCDEIAAIVRHEAGHIKLLHLPVKMFFVLLPMVALILDQTHTLGIHHALTTLLNRTWSGDVPVANVVQATMATVFVIYLFVVLRWLNHRLEHEADLFAAMEPNSQNDLSANEHAQSALAKLAVISPRLSNRSTFLHPSIDDRIALLQSCETDRGLASDFRRSYRRRNLVILLPWVIILALSALG